MRGHYPVAQGDPMGLVLGAVLALAMILIVGAFVWFLVGGIMFGEDREGGDGE